MPATIHPTYLRHLRTRAGMDQVDLAPLVGVTQGQYSKIENGLKPLPDLDRTQWHRLGQALMVRTPDEDGSDRTPLFVLATSPGDPEEFSLLADEHSNVGGFADGNLAQRAATILAALAMPDVSVVPCSPVYAQWEAERTPGATAEAHVYVVDELLEGDPVSPELQTFSVLVRTAEHAASVVRWFLNRRTLTEQAG